MDPPIRQFSERRPRLYGFLLLLLGVAFAVAGHRISGDGRAFTLLLFAAACGAGGLYYLIFGPRAHSWDVTVEKDFAPHASLSWKQVCAATGGALALAALTALLFKLLR